MESNIIYESENSVFCVELLYEIGGYYTYNIKVASNGFSGVYTFCIEKKVLKLYVETIENMIDSLSGECDLRDCESDSFINIFFIDDMSLYVTGEIGGSYNDHFLKFKFKADQTLLYGLKHNLLNY